VKRFTPEFVKRWNRFGIPTGNVMLGFKRFRNAAATISGIELIIAFNFSTFRLKDTAASAVWNAVLFNR
jgi:hypothetical protein